MKATPLSWFLLPSLLVMAVFLLSAQAGSLDNWHPRYITATPGFSSVTCSESLFVGVGAQGVIPTSPDGTNWAAPSSGVTAFLTRAALSTLRAQKQIPISISSVPFSYEGTPRRALI